MNPVLQGRNINTKDQCGQVVDLLIIKETDRPFVERIGEVLALCDAALPVEPLTPEELACLIWEPLY